MLTLAPARAQAPSGGYPATPVEHPAPDPYLYVDADNGCYPMYNTVTGTASGGRTPANYPSSPAYPYGPAPGDWNFPSGTATYDPDTGHYNWHPISASASEGRVTDPNTGDSWPLASSSSATGAYTWKGYFVWQGAGPAHRPRQRDFLLAAQVPPPTPPSAALRGRLHRAGA